MHCCRCTKHRCIAVDAQGRDANVDAQDSDALLYMLKAEMHHCRCSRQRFIPWGLQWNSSSWALTVRICGSLTFGNALSLFLGLGLEVLRGSVTSFVSSQPLILHSLSFRTSWLRKPSFGVLASSRLYLNSLSGTLPFLMVLHHLALDGVLSFQWCSEFFVCFLVVAAIIVVTSGSPQAGCSRYLFFPQVLHPTVPETKTTLGQKTSREEPLRLWYCNPRWDASQTSRHPAHILRREADTPV